MSHWRGLECCLNRLVGLGGFELADGLEQPVDHGLVLIIGENAPRLAGRRRRVLRERDDLQTVPDMVFRAFWGDDAGDHWPAATRDCCCSSAAMIRSTAAMPTSRSSWLRSTVSPRRRVSMAAARFNRARCSGLIRTMRGLPAILLCLPTRPTFPGLCRNADV